MLHCPLRKHDQHGIVWRCVPPGGIVLRGVSWTGRLSFVPSVMAPLAAPSGMAPLAAPSGMAPLAAPSVPWDAFIKWVGGS